MSKTRMLRDFLMVLQKVDGTAPVREDWEWAMVILADYSFNQYDPKVCGKVAKTRTDMLAYLGIDAGEFNAVVKSAATKLTHHNFACGLMKFRGFTAESTEKFFAAVLDDYEWMCRFRAVVIQLYRGVPLVQAVMGHPIGVHEALTLQQVLRTAGWVLMATPEREASLLNYQDAIARIQHAVSEVYKYFSSADTRTARTSLPREIAFLVMGYQCTYLDLVDWPLKKVVRTCLRSECNADICYEREPDISSHYMKMAMAAMHSGVAHLKVNMTVRSSRISALPGTGGRKVFMELPLSSLGDGSSYVAERMEAVNPAFHDSLREMCESMPWLSKPASLLGGVYDFGFTRWLASEAGTAAIRAAFKSKRPVPYGNHALWDYMASEVEAYSTIAVQLVRKYLLGTGMDAESFDVALSEMRLAVGGA